MSRDPTLYLTVGLPGTGKTTRAKALAAQRHILRLTPDDWMAPLFGQSDADGRRDILEGRMIWVAMIALEVEEQVRRDRAARLIEARATTFEMTDEDHDRCLAMVQLPTEDELGAGPLPKPTDGFSTWGHWASSRWPTLPIILTR